MKKHLIITITASMVTNNSLVADTMTLSDTNLSSVVSSLSKDMIVLPYVFSTDSTGFSGGVGVIKRGLLQPQTTAIATLFYGAKQDITTNGSSDTANFSGGMVSFFNYRIPGTERLLFIMPPFVKTTFSSIIFQTPQASFRNAGI